MLPNCRISGKFVYFGEYSRSEEQIHGRSNGNFCAGRRKFARALEHRRPNISRGGKRLVVGSAKGWLGLRYRRPTGSPVRKGLIAAPSCWLIRIPCQRYVISPKEIKPGPLEKPDTTPPPVMRLIITYLALLITSFFFLPLLPSLPPLEKITH